MGGSPIPDEVTPALATPPGATVPVPVTPAPPLNPPPMPPGPMGDMGTPPVPPRQMPRQAIPATEFTDAQEALPIVSPVYLQRPTDELDRLIYKKLNFNRELPKGAQLFSDPAGDYRASTEPLAPYDFRRIFGEGIKQTIPGLARESARAKAHIQSVYGSLDATPGYDPFADQEIRDRGFGDRMELFAHSQSKNESRYIMTYTRRREWDAQQIANMGETATLTAAVTGMVVDPVNMMPLTGVGTGIVAKTAARGVYGYLSYGARSALVGLVQNNALIELRRSVDPTYYENHVIGSMMLAASVGTAAGFLREAQVRRLGKLGQQLDSPNNPYRYREIPWEQGEWMDEASKVLQTQYITDSIGQSAITWDRKIFDLHAAGVSMQPFPAIKPLGVGLAGVAEMLDNFMTLETRQASRKFVTGAPTIVDAFHGTPFAIGVATHGFQQKHLGITTGAGSAKEGFFFARRPSTSRAYHGNDAGVDPSGRIVAPGMVPTQVKFENPLVYDFGGKDYRERTFYELIREAKRKGHDGVILSNVSDGFGHDIIYVAFNADQVRMRLVEKHLRPGPITKEAILRHSNRLPAHMIAGASPEMKAAIKATPAQPRWAGEFSIRQSANGWDVVHTRPTGHQRVVESFPTAEDATQYVQAQKFADKFAPPPGGKPPPPPDSDIPDDYNYTLAIKEPIRPGGPYVVEATTPSGQKVQFGQAATQAEAETLLAHVVDQREAALAQLRLEKTSGYQSVVEEHGLWQVKEVQADGSKKTIEAYLNEAEARAHLHNIQNPDNPVGTIKVVPTDDGRFSVTRTVAMGFEDLGTFATEEEATAAAGKLWAESARITSHELYRWALRNGGDFTTMKSPGIDLNLPDAERWARRNGLDPDKIEEPIPVEQPLSGIGLEQPSKVTPALPEGLYGSEELMAFASKQGVKFTNMTFPTKVLNLEEATEWAIEHGLDPASLAKPKKGNLTILKHEDGTWSVSRAPPAGKPGMYETIAHGIASEDEAYQIYGREMQKEGLTPKTRPAALAQADPAGNIQAALKKQEPELEEEFAGYKMTPKQARQIAIDEGLDPDDLPPIHGPMTPEEVEAWMYGADDLLDDVPAGGKTTGGGFAGDFDPHDTGPPMMTPDDLRAMASFEGIPLDKLPEITGPMTHEQAAQWLESAPPTKSVLETVPAWGDVNDPAAKSLGAAAVQTGAAPSALPGLFDRESLASTGIGLENYAWTPVMRLKQSASLFAREMVESLVSMGGLLAKKNQIGAFNGMAPEATRTPVEVRMAQNHTPFMIKALQGIENEWLASRSAAAKSYTEAPIGNAWEGLKLFATDKMGRTQGLSLAEFEERVGMALRRGDTDPWNDHYSQYVNRAAVYGREMLERQKKMAVEVQLFEKAYQEKLGQALRKVEAIRKDPARQAELEAAEIAASKIEEHLHRLKTQGPMTNTAPSYFPRIWKVEELLNRDKEFVQITRDWLVRTNAATPGEAEIIARRIHERLARISARPDLSEISDMFEEALNPQSALARTFEIPDQLVESFLESNAGIVLRHSSRTMAPDIELMREFGSTNLEPQMATVRADYEKALANVSDPRMRLEMMKQRERDIEDIKALRDKLRGTYGAEKDPHSWTSRTIRVLKNYATWTTMGLSAYSQMGDLFRPAITEGLDAVNRFGFGTLVDESRALIYRMAREERLYSGDAFEIVTSARSLAASDVGDIYMSRSRLERQANQMTGLFFMLNGMNMATDFTKDVASVIIQGRMNDSIMRWFAQQSPSPGQVMGFVPQMGKPLEAWEIERLTSLGIDAAMANRIAVQLKKHQVQFKSITLANSAAWTDQAAQESYRSALLQSLHRTVVTPGVGDRPNWMSTELGSLIMQFRSFGTSSAIRTMYAGLQEKGYNFWVGAAVLVGGAMVMNEIRKQVFYGRSSFDQPYTGVLADAIDRSGVLGVFFDANNALEVFSGGQLGIRPFLGAGNTYTPLSRVANSLGGPVAGQFTNAVDILGDVMSGNATAQTWRKMRNLVPGQNLPYADPVFDVMFPKGDGRVGKLSDIARPEPVLQPDKRVTRQAERASGSPRLSEKDRLFDRRFPLPPKGSEQELEEREILYGREKATSIPYDRYVTDRRLL